MGYDRPEDPEESFTLEVKVVVKGYGKTAHQKQLLGKIESALKGYHIDVESIEEMFERC